MNKWNNRLIIIFFAVVAIGVFYLYINSIKSGVTSLSDITGVQFSNFNIDEITLYPAAHSDAGIHFIRSEGQWFIENSNGRLLADQNLVDALLSELLNLEIQKVVATGVSGFARYAITDSAASRLLISSKGSRLCDIYVGSRLKGPSGSPGRTYIRLSDKPVVFACRGVLNEMTFNSVDEWRSRRLINRDPESWQSVEFIYPIDSGFKLIRSDTAWLLEGETIDPIKLRRIIYPLSAITHSNFAQQELNQLNGEPVFSVLLEDSTGIFSRLDIWPTDDQKYLLKSSSNKGNLFEFNRSEISGRILIAKSAFK